MQIELESLPSDLAAAHAMIRAEREARLAADPSDGRGWSVLAPVYMRMGRFDDAAHAYEAATRILGESAQRLSDWGEAQVAAANGAVTPQAKAIFQRAVEIDADYVGFTCPDVFVVGYGMDVAHSYRQLPFVGVVDHHDAEPDLFGGT